MKLQEAIVTRILGALLAASSASAGEPLVVGYLPTWTNLATQMQHLDLSNVTHLNLAFVNPTDATGTLVFEDKAAAVIEKAHASKVKVLFSLGGGGAAEDPIVRGRYQHLLTSENRPRFVKSLADFATAHAFDGIDVDLEGPSIFDTYGAFIKDLAAALRPKRLLLTAAISKGYGGDRVPVEALQEFDWVNIMAYDATGPWAPQRPGPHAPLHFARQCVDWWLGRGLKPEHAVLGLPFYGYGFGDGVKAHWEFAEIIKTWPDAAQRDESGSTVYYNGLPTIKAKCLLARNLKLAGVMIWHLAADATGKDSLLAAIRRELRPEAAASEP